MDAGMAVKGLSSLAENAITGLSKAEYPRN